MVLNIFKQESRQIKERFLNSACKKNDQKKPKKEERNQSQ